MKPLDYRNANYADLRSRLQGDRLRVLSAWRQHGPGTTREVAMKANMDLLSFRPRTTELHQLGLVELLQDKEDPDLRPRDAHEGMYRALSDAEAMGIFRERCRDARKETQGVLGI